MRWFRRMPSFLKSPMVGYSKVDKVSFGAIHLTDIGRRILHPPFYANLKIYQDIVETRIEEPRFVIGSLYMPCTMRNKKHIMYSPHVCCFCVKSSVGAILTLTDCAWCFAVFCFLTWDQGGKLGPLGPL